MSGEASSDALRNWSNVRWYWMWAQAEQRGHLAPPPYASPGLRDAWRDGYLNALRDIAQRRVDAR